MAREPDARAAVLVSIRASTARVCVCVCVVSSARARARADLHAEPLFILLAGGGGGRRGSRAGSPSFRTGARWRTRLCGRARALNARHHARRRGAGMTTRVVPWLASARARARSFASDAQMRRQTWAPRRRLHRAASKGIGLARAVGHFRRRTAAAGVRARRSPMRFNRAPPQARRRGLSAGAPCHGARVYTAASPHASSELPRAGQCGLSSP